MFGKIPRKSISIPTVTNEDYSPDFMYIVKKKDGTKELKLIVETKGIDMKAELRDKEQRKIDCAKVFFKRLCEDYSNFNVNFEDQLNGEQLLSIISDLTK